MPNMNPLGLSVREKQDFKDFLPYLYVRPSTPSHRANFYPCIITWSILLGSWDNNTFKIFLLYLEVKSVTPQHLWKIFPSSFIIWLYYVEVYIRHCYIAKYKRSRPLVWEKKILKNFLLYLYVKSGPQQKAKFKPSIRNWNTLVEVY